MVKWKRDKKYTRSRRRSLLLLLLLLRSSRFLSSRCALLLLLPMQISTQDDTVLDDGLTDQLDAPGAEDLCAAGDFVATVLLELLALCVFINIFIDKIGVD